MSRSRATGPSRTGNSSGKPSGPALTRKRGEAAFETYFEARLTTRYLKPIESLQASHTLNGEGFRLLAIHCSMIEFLESTLQGRTYRFRPQVKIHHSASTSIRNSGQMFTALPG